MSKAASMTNDLEILSGGGDMGERLRGVDWAQHGLGSVEHWPQALKASLSICLNTAFPIAIYWGPDAILLYNDAWRPIVGNKHPWALGRPGREVWSEIWDVVGPVFEGVMATGEGSFQRDALLSMHRHGYTEECYFDYTFSPIRGEGGAIEGVFNAVSETTFRVLSERRSGLLRELATQAAGAKTLDEACRAAARALATDPHDVPFALLYLVEDGSARLAGSHGIAPGHPGGPAHVRLGTTEDGAWNLGSAVDAPEGRVIDLSGGPLPPIHAAPWPEPVTKAYVRPVGARGARGTAAVLVLGISPRLELDKAYQEFCRLAGVHLSAAFDNMHALEVERRRAESLAELDRAKTAFFSNISHELRTPLTLMLGPLQDALANAHGVLPRGAAADLTIAHRNTLRLNKLVNTLLDFSRAEAGRIEASFEPTDLAAFTADLASTFRSAIERAGLRLVVSCPPLSEPVYIDRDMWEKIVLNLLSNAFKYTLQGEIRVSLREVGECAQLSIADTGTGIPAEAMPRLFERFFRVEGTHGRTHEGTGIGLALVHDLCGLHGGRVAAQSEYGRGSTFTVTIPRGMSHLPAERVHAGQTLASTTIRAVSFADEALSWLGEECPIVDAMAEHGASMTARPPDAPTILLADDNRDMRGYLERLLSGRYRVVAVGDGEEALRAARRERPDLVVTDVMMPKLDGFGLLRELRLHRETAALPVILLSARAGEEDRIEGLARGADDYLVKPFSARELVARVESQLQLARVRAEATRARGESERRFRELIDSLPAAVYTTDAAGRITHFNPACVEFSGRTPMLGSDQWCVTWKLFHPDGRPMPHDECPMALALKSGASISGAEAIAERPDGTRLWFTPYPTPLLDSAGEVIGGINMLVDVTERKLAEVALAGEKEALEMLARGEPLERTLAFLIETAESCSGGRVHCSIALVNDAQSHFGEGVGPKLCQSYHDAVRGLAIDTDLGSCCRAVLTGLPVFIPDVTADPQWARFAAIIAPMGYRAAWSTLIRGSSGEILGAFANYSRAAGPPSDRETQFVETITRTAAVIIERHQAEQRLRESEARFRAFTNATSDVVYRMSADWTEMRQLHGREFIADTLESSSAWLDKYIHPDDQDRVLEAIRLAIETGSDFELEHRVIRVDGSLGWTRSHAIPIRDDHGDVVEWFGAASDISRRKQVEEELRLREVLIAGQREALELALNDAPLHIALGALVRTAVATVGQDARAGFYLANEERTALHHVVGMGAAYAEAVDGFTIGPDSLACGLATHAGRPILTSDVREDPLWKPWLWMADKFDYRACWSFPIHSAMNKFVGTLAVYSPQPREATARDIEACSLLTHTASIIISRHTEWETRKRIEQTLRDSEARYRQTLALLPAAVYSCDAAGVITYFNQHAAQLWGREPVLGDVDERFCGSERLLLPDGTPLPHEQCPMAMALRDGRSFRNADVIVQRPDGSRFHASVNIDPFRDASGTVIGAVNAFRDVTAIKEAEEVLRRSEERFRNIFACSNDAIFVVDPQRDAILDANPRACAMLGYSSEELLSLSITAVHPDEMPELRAFAQDVSARGQGWTDELSCLTKSGTSIPAEISASRFVDTAGRTCLLALVRDITERKAAERALRESEQRFHVLADNIDQLAWTCDAELGHVTWYNQRWLDYTGLTFDQTKEWGWEGVVHPDHIDRVVSSVQHATDVGCPWDDTVPLRGKDGRYRWFLSRAVPIRDEAGAVVRWFGTNTDVTALREIAQSLRESEERFRTFTDAAPAMLWVADADGMCTFLSLGWYSFTGQIEGEGLGLGRTNAIHPDDREACARAFRAASAAQQPAFSVEYRLRRADGEYRWALDIGRARFAADGSFLGYVGNVLDVHEQKLTADELTRHREQLQQMVDARTAELEASHRQLRLSERMAALGTLSAGLGHDMGNLLVPIRVRLESLWSSDLPEHLKKDVEAIKTSAEYLRKLSSGLRQLAVDPAHGGASESTELRSWWEEAEPMLRNSLPRGITLDSRMGAQPCWARVSRAALTQAVFNLVQNAGDAMRERGTGRVKVWSDCTNGSVRVGVTDNGPGMTPEVRARCMEPFFTTKARGISTGMGLALVYGIIKDARGSIAIDSQPGSGTTFELTLPACEPPAPPMSAGDRVASIEVRDPRLRAIVTAELRSLEFDVRPRSAGHPPEVLVLDDAAQIDREADEAAVVLLADPGESVNDPGVIATGARPVPRIIREALRQAVALNRRRGER